MRFVDSHCHVADAAFDADLDDVVHRAFTTGAVAIVCVGESLAAADRAARIARQYGPRVAWTAGIHPYDAASYDPSIDLNGIRERMSLGACAIGECGLDGTYDNAPRHLQRRAFAEQLGLARELGKPVIVHTRAAIDDTIAMVREAGLAGVKGVMHCFTGPRDLAECALDVGWHISFSGVVTFKKWEGDDLIRLVPSDRLLVETDAPYLAPVPHRGKRNEPAFITQTIDHVARARGVAPEELGAVVANNAIRFFGLAVPLA